MEVTKQSGPKLQKEIAKKVRLTLDEEVIRFMDRGVKWDLNERIYQNPKEKEILGEGDNKFLLRK